MGTQTEQSVNSLYREIQESAAQLGTATVRLSELLTEARGNKTEAEFSDWLRINTVLPENKAREYMAIGTALKEKTA